MVDDYESFKKCYGKGSSWAVWSKPYYGKWRSKDSIEDLNVVWEKKCCSIEEVAKKLFESKNTKFIFVGLNPSNHPSACNHEEDECNSCRFKKSCKVKDKIHKEWSSFHSGCLKKSQDYKIRYVLHEKYPELWGSFLIDILEVVDSNGNLVNKKTTENDWNKGIDDLLRAREMLGGHAVLVPMGQYAFDKLCDYRVRSDYKDRFDGIVIRGIRHFSAPGIDKFKNAVGDLCKDSMEDQNPRFFKGYKK